MSKTPSQVVLSKSLKERLKKCGRYHASPEPVAIRPKLSTTLDHDKTPNDAHVIQESVSPKMKRQCLDGSYLTSAKNDELSNKSPLLTKHSDICSYRKYSEERENIDETLTRSTDDCSLNQTPVTQRSWSSAIKMKVNKLNFEDACKEKDVEENNDIKDQSVENLQQDSLKCLNENLVHSDIELPSVSKAKLMKELETKEEHLRKLRMVKMYRSKNNLEELQGLIDKWRAVSQQALQDLHSAMPEPRPSLTELINHLGIDHQLLHFSAEDDESFF